MVMAGLERPDSGEVVVNGTPFNALDEDALARFRGRQVGIVFQSFHLIPTMTALENVAVPLELAGDADASKRAAQELASVGLGDRLHHYPTQLSGGEQQRVALARALVPDPAILVADEPTGNLDEATGKQIVDLLFTKHAERGMTLGAGDARHRAGAALRSRGAAALGPHRGGQLRSRQDFMSVASESIGSVAAPASSGRMVSLSLRYALRELRGGLRGFYVFISCIALGVMAIAGVGSVSASLGDGLAREGRNLLGGDIAFVLFQREAKPDELAFLRSRGELSVIATLRAMARASDGRLALVEMKAVDGLYPSLGELTLNPKLPLRDILEQRDGVFGAAADPTLLARLDLKIGDKVSVGEATFQIRSAVEAEPDKLGVGVGFGPRFLVSEDALRATGLLQPGSLVRWNYRLKLPENAADDRAMAALIDDSRTGGARSRLGNAQPRQRFARARAHHQSLHAIPHPRRPCRAAGRRCRRRQRRQEPYRSQARRDRRLQGARRHRPRRVRDLPHAGHAARRLSAR